MDQLDEEREELMRRIGSDFGYSREELLAFEWIKIEDNPETQGNVFWDSRGQYVLFAKDKVIWW